VATSGSSSSGLKTGGGHASMSTMHHFNEFVKAFCDFGSEMVHLMGITTGKKIFKKSSKKI
jgi:hypothetical protein